MPPKPRIDRDMILQAAYAIAREQGAEQLNARAIAQRMGCSTQPVLYYFDHVDDIRMEVYRMADAYHAAFLMQLPEDANPMIALGLNYIRFAEQEKSLFRLLFQSNSFSGQSITQLTDNPELLPILEIFRHETGLGLQQTKTVFKTLLMLVHGCASMLANNAMDYNESELIPMLENAFFGIITIMKTEDTQS